VHHWAGLATLCATAAIGHVVSDRAPASHAVAVNWVAMSLSVHVPEYKTNSFFPESFESISNFKILYQIQFLSKIHEIGFIILLNSMSIQENYKT
jgi:hypothetical protein